MNFVWTRRAAGALLLAGGLAAGWVATSGGETPPAAKHPAATTASQAFWDRWGNGTAELDGYRIVMPRYGAPREGRAVLVYVTEPSDSRTWIKDDQGTTPSAYRVNVLKLNHILKFQTGIYPYSVMTSVFSPVDALYPERFAPARITLTAQEWCGQVYQSLRAKRRGFRHEIRSYFSAEGERETSVRVPRDTVYEDALWIQLRELDGPFADGKDWEGTLVPSLWRARRSHVPVRGAAATVRREDADRDGIPVTRFHVRYGTFSRTFDVEKASPRRILGWTTSDGERAELTGSTRLPYWKLNRPGDEAYLSKLGFPVPGAAQREEIGTGR